MSAATVKAAIEAQLATVPGILGVLPARPVMAHSWPFVYTWFDGFTRDYGGQVVAMHYRLSARVFVPAQDSEAAEATIVSFANSIPAAIDVGAYPAPIARVTTAEGRAGTGETETYDQIGETIFRVLTFLIEAIEKAPYRSGI